MCERLTSQNQFLLDDTSDAASRWGGTRGVRSDQDWLVDTQFLLNVRQMKRSGSRSLDLEVNLPGNSPRDPSPLPPNQINSSTLSGLPASVCWRWPHELVKHRTDDRSNTVKHRGRAEAWREGQRLCYQWRKELGGREWQKRTRGEGIREGSRGSQRHNIKEGGCIRGERRALTMRESRKTVEGVKLGSEVRLRCQVITSASQLQTSSYHRQGVLPSIQHNPLLCSLTRPYWQL